MKRTDSVVEISGLIQGDDASAWISNLWDTYNNARAKKREQWKEVDEYLFATDTTTTSNSSLPWTHNTTSPKLTQIRDNLHANYLSSLFPNDKWLSWVAFSKDSAKRETSKTILAYMENKTREGGFRNTVSRLLYDYIDKGNAFAMPSFEARYNISEFQKVADFVGPKAVRIPAHDIVFDPTAVDFESTHKIIRSYITVGDLKKLATTNPAETFWAEAHEHRQQASRAASQFSQADWHKASQYMMDGFGSLQDYYQSNTVEILEFYGDYYDNENDVLHENQMITVVDRSVVVRQIDIPTYGGRPAIRHVGWRLRPENLWAMGPLDNLVGMQYMIDHYLNMSANALDLKVMSPKKVVGDQQYGDIYTVLQYISELEERMEMYAGAPREAMGIRTPGEKTAFEMQSLENAAGRIFNEKIIQFEVFLEQVLNDMLEESHRNMSITDVVRIVDNDLGVQQFKEVTKEDITANGILRPVGARHFAQRSQEMQNLVGVFNGPLAQILGPHTSAIGLTQFISDVIDLRGYTVFQPNIAIAEQQETQALANQAEEDNIASGMQSEEELMMAHEMSGAPMGADPDAV